MIVLLAVFSRRLLSIDLKQEIRPSAAFSLSIIHFKSMHRVQPSAAAAAAADPRQGFLSDCCIHGKFIAVCSRIWAKSGLWPEPCFQSLPSFDINHKSRICENPFALFFCLRRFICCLSKTWSPCKRNLAWSLAVHLASFYDLKISVRALTPKHLQGSAKRLCKNCSHWGKIIVSVCIILTVFIYVIENMQGKRCFLRN